MNLVIVKHENCDQKYLFRVTKNVYAGELVRVRTKKGDTLATCLCDSFSIEDGSDEYETILSAFGATEPLSYVIGSYYYSPFHEIENIENDSV